MTALARAAFMAMTYRATVSRHGAERLLVEGCVLFVCQKQVWWKASVLAEALRLP